MGNNQTCYDKSKVPSSIKQLDQLQVFITDEIFRIKTKLEEFKDNNERRKDYKGDLRSNDQDYAISSISYYVVLYSILTRIKACMDGIDDPNEEGEIKLERKKIIRENKVKKTLKFEKCINFVELVLQTEDYHNEDELKLYADTLYDNIHE